VKKSKQKRRVRAVVKKWKRKRQTISSDFLARDEVIIVPEYTPDPKARRQWHMPEFISLVNVDDTGVKVRDGFKLRWVVSQVAYDSMVSRYKEAKRRLKKPDVTPHEQLIFRTVKRELRKTVRESRDGAWTTEDIYEPLVVRIKEGRKDEGKHFRWRKLVAHVYVSPSGKKYVQAKHNEKAVLIIRYPNSDLRLRLFDSSLVAKRIRQRAEELERGAAKLEAKKERGKKKRESRKSFKRGQQASIKAAKKNQDRLKGHTHIDLTGFGDFLKDKPRKKKSKRIKIKR
jgi:hypothetical protein